MVLLENNSHRAPVQDPPACDLQSFLDAVDASELLATLQAYRWTGRPGHSLRALWNSYLTTFLLNLPSTNALIRELEDNLQTREACGFNGELPRRRTFNRFIRRLAEHDDLVEACFAGLTAKLKELLPDLGNEVAVDSTAIRTHSQPNRKQRSDPDAAWGVRHTPQAKSKDGTVFFYGYKDHVICDANYGIPLAFITTPGNRNDSPELPPVIERAKAQHSWFAPAAVMADRGYDSMSNHDYVVKQGALPIIHIKKQPGGTLREGIYTTAGVPTCFGNVPMEYVRTNDQGKHLYRCRGEGCHLRDTLKGGSKHCVDEYLHDPGENLRVFGAIRRDGPEWKRLYGKRWAIEQLFKTWKESRRLERHYVRGLKQIRLHSLMSMLAFQATALVKVQSGEQASMRWMVRRVV